MLIILKQLFILYVFLLIGWGFGKLKKDIVSHTGGQRSDMALLFLVHSLRGQPVQLLPAGGSHSITARWVLSAS